MKISRNITVILFISGIIIVIISIINNWFSPDNSTQFNIITNLLCGLIIGIITSISQYFTERQKSINKIYNAYFDIYKTYYYIKKSAVFFHYNAFSLYKKINDLGPIINEVLDEYTGIFIKRDKTYKKLNPDFQIKENYNFKNIKHTILIWFNKNSFENIIEPIIKEIKNILIKIDRNKFYNDEKIMKEVYRKLYE